MVDLREINSGFVIDNLLLLNFQKSSLPCVGIVLETKKPCEKIGGKLFFIHTFLDSKPRGTTSMIFGRGSLLTNDLCGGVSGIILNTQRICGANFLGTQVTCVAGNSSSN